MHKIKSSIIILLTMLVMVSGFSGNVVKAIEPTATPETTLVQSEETTIPEPSGEPSANVEVVNEAQAVDQIEPSPVVYAVNSVIEVPESAMVIVNGVYYGVSKSWYEGINPDNAVLQLSITLPSSVVTVGDDAFKDSCSNDKQNNQCITNYNYASDKKYTDKYKVVALDFSNATNLTTINKQAASGCADLTGVLDLSKTKVTTIHKSAFGDCSGLTGVILPDTLTTLGDNDSGSVFFNCSGLTFVRSASSSADTVFELPAGLQLIGTRSFKGCTGLVTNITIPATVTHIGTEAFYESGVKTITVLSNNPSGYNRDAFKGTEYGLDKRLIVFNNAEAKNKFPRPSNQLYNDALTFEYELQYGDGQVEKKLCGQKVNVCKDENGKWYVNDQYVIPTPQGEAPVGYDLAWKYGNTIIKNNTLIKPTEDVLKLTVATVLEEPKVEIIVDDKPINDDNTYQHLNLSDNKRHYIGVNVTHPIQDVTDATERVNFKYKWTDVWQGGKLGPRNNDRYFGEDGWGEPKGRNTISIYGPTDERTNGTYSKENYGIGYYLLEIYGYKCPKSGGSCDLFYKSASTVIGSDPLRTTDTGYLFDVVTSPGAIIPDVKVDNTELVYGHPETRLVATFKKVEGQTYKYQWYKATEPNQNINGEKMEGETSNELAIPAGLDANEYYYYLEVTTTKELNNDTEVVVVPVTLTIAKADSKIQIMPESMDKTYNKVPVVTPEVHESGSTSDIVYEWYKKTNDGTWDKLAGNPVNAGAYKIVVSVAKDKNYKSASTEKEFVINKAIPVVDKVEGLVIGQGKPLSKLELPKGFTWKDDTIVADKLGDFEYDAVFTPEDIQNYETVDVKISVKVVPLQVIVNHAPVIKASDIIIKVNDKFDDTIAKKAVSAHDEEDGDLTSKIVVVENLVDTSKAGTYKVTFKVTDTKGASMTKNIIVTVKAEPIVKPTVKPEPTKKPVDNGNGGYDDGGPFTTDECGSVYDRWGNLMWKAPACDAKPSDGYNIVNTSDF